MELQRLQEQLEQIGLEERQRASVLQTAVDKGPSFVSDHWHTDKEEMAKVRLYIQCWQLQQYDVTLKSINVIPDVIVGGIAAVQLDLRMKAVDWSSANASGALHDYFKGVTPEVEHTEIRDILHTVFSLNGKGTEEQNIAEKLMMKHWLESSFKSNFPNHLVHLRDKLEKTCIIPMHYDITVNDAKSLLRGELMFKELNINGKKAKCQLALNDKGDLLVLKPTPTKIMDNQLSL